MGWKVCTTEGNPRGSGALHLTRSPVPPPHTLSSPSTSHALQSPEEASSSPAVVEEASLALPGFLPRGAFFTDTSESESELESDLVMSTVAFPISESESTLESESEPDSTFCRHRVGLDPGRGVAAAQQRAPKHSSMGHSQITEASARSLLVLNLHPAHGRALPPPSPPPGTTDPGHLSSFPPAALQTRGLLPSSSSPLPASSGEPWPLASSRE